ncbi:MAG TPA: sulfurtransferase-like selenium metabolism protein YedF [Bacillota bacterium]|nr:sulfurtransferase-like selenium metabolism protein YedF [Bacillota bacterium]HOP68734.1 sulfurtransferase-like selenium metabolism protein YedF [Bacillota bacterium]HPT33737.1 sulfurtransferase-like selenium metabolism protein YedF [Bacillota bacterium]HPZ64765.1 sulfurtransferase-like selenium metabolism protein YedF [Bacillota bacterium]HQD06835.1 sulfurtransferase-like selenium metabolism protein YedF [Bacillota bacterium]
MKEIDCRGLNCPEPVLRTKKALEEHGPDLLCIVNSKTARENIIRFARSQDLEASWEQKGTDYHVRILSPREAKSPSPRPEETPCSSREKRVLLIGGDALGRGSGELGLLLMRNFIYTLTRTESPPGTIIFLNAGVKLTTAGSPVLEELARLEERGVEILSCGTCLDYYRLSDSLSVGKVCNMYDIVELLCGENPVTIL